MEEKEKKMCYDLAIEENGFSPMDVDELLWINGGSTTIEIHDKSTKTKNSDGSSETQKDVDIIITTDGPDIIDVAKKVWDGIKNLFKKGE